MLDATEIERLSKGDRVPAGFSRLSPFRPLRYRVYVPLGRFAMYGR